MVIDGDGHCNEPRDLFDRYLEKEFRERGPKVVDAHGMRWMIEGKFLPRPVGTWGHGTSSGYFGTNMAKKGMATTTQSLDDVPGRLKDLDTEGIDIQVVYPNITAMASHLDDGELAAAMCRAYNNYVAEQSRGFQWTRQAGRCRGTSKSRGGSEGSSARCERSGAGGNCCNRYCRAKKSR